MKSQSKYEIRITGFGGQGVISMGKILGRTAAIGHQRHATLIQSYGPETRGSACRVDLLVSDAPNDYPYLSKPRLLLVLSQDGYAKFRGTLAPGGALFYDETLVKLNAEDAALAALKAEERPAGATQLIAVPALRIAEQVGNRIMTNMAMLGYCVGMTEMVSLAALEKVVAEMVPKATIEANLTAVRQGYKLAQEPSGDLALV